MSKIPRIITMVCLPVFTLALGWQLGAQFELNAIREREQQLDLLFAGGTGSVLQDPEREVDLTLFWNVWRLLLKHYIEPMELKTGPLLFGAVRGLVEAVDDPYTTFMTPDENKQFRDALSGKLQGIGAELALRDGRIVVIAPLKGSPAEKAGLLPGDVILNVGGTATEDRTLQEVVQDIRGPKGTSVTLLVSRDNEDDPLSFTIVRDDIQVPSVETDLRTSARGDVAVIAINQFGGETIHEITESLQILSKRDTPLKGIILDLRFNGGGYLEGAVDLASLFLREGKVVTVERRTAEPQRHYVSGRPIFPDTPLAVIVNQGTASASEIVAGALQDHKRATIIGVQTFGKGTVQEVIDLPGGGSLRVTTARWLTPGGRDLGKEGVLPQIEIDRTQENLDAGRDPQLDAAMELLLTGKKPTPAKEAE